MNTRVIEVLLVALICITMAAPAMAQPTSFVITGQVSDSDASPCNDPWVRITNTNTSVSWDAENDSASNYYKLVLDSEDVSVGNILSIEASGCSKSKTVTHTVTIGEFNCGGFIEDITFEAATKPDLTVITLDTPANLRNDVINPISATVENTGASGAGSFNVSLDVDGTSVDTATITSLAAGENTTVELLWTPAATGNATLTVTADAGDSVDESDESNNNLSQTVDVLDKLTVTANVRIEGMNETVWTGDVTFSSSVLTATDGSIHYLNEPTALGALDCANTLGGFGYVLVKYDWGLYVSEVAGEPAIGWDGWMYRVNYVSPSVGAADYTLTDSDEVLWYFGAWTAPPLAIELSATGVSPGEEFVATVTAYNDTSGLFEPVNNATVYADGLTFQTGTDGNATLSIGTAGDYTVYADKGTWADYTRSEKVNVAVIDESKPDLIVITLDTPTNLRNDVINPISATVENTGASGAGSFNVSLDVDGTSVDTATITSLAAGENTTVELLWMPAATGNATLTVTADAGDSVDESDESNNNLSQTVDVLDKLTVTANVRIEGMNETVWTGDVTFSSSVLTATDGSIHYLNEPTALGALDCANTLGGFGYVLVKYDWGLYVEEIAGEPAIGWDGWMYRVNYVSPSVGAADYTLTDSDEVLWYFGTWTAPPLAIELSATGVSPGEEFVATVTAYNDTSGLFEPVNNATVYADGLTFQTGTDGNATLSIGTAGDYTVYADKGTWADYTRSEKKAVKVLSVESYGESVYAEMNTGFAWSALDEPDDWGAVLSRDAMIAIELEETVPSCKDVSVRVARLGFQTVYFDVAVSSDGTSWDTIGSETCGSWMTWEDYDFNGDFGDVRYIKITKPGTWWTPRLMGLDAVYAKN